MKNIKFRGALGSDKRFKFGDGVLENMIQNFKNCCEKEVQKMNEKRKEWYCKKDKNSLVLSKKT